MNVRSWMRATTWKTVPHSLIARTVSTLLAALWVVYLALLHDMVGGTARLHERANVFDRELGGGWQLTAVGVFSAMFIVVAIVVAWRRHVNVLRYLLALWWWWIGCTMIAAGLIIGGGLAISAAVGTTVGWWTDRIHHGY